MVGAPAGYSTARAADAEQNAGTASAWLSPLPTKPVGMPVADPAPETLRLYAADQREFAVWCRATGCAPLPASMATLAAYLLAMAPRLSRGALGRRRAAIGTMHRKAGLPVPVLDLAALAALRRAARRRTLPRPTLPRDAAGFERLAARCLGDLAGLRDRALLLLAAATRDRRVTQGAVLGLDAEHVRFTAAGVTLHLRRRADEAAPSHAVALTRLVAGMAAAACPVRALEDWLRTSATRFGPVFRKIDRWGNVEHARLGPDGWRRIVARRAERPRRRRASAPERV